MEPTLKIPADLKKALAADPDAKAMWDGLTHLGRRDFITWIIEAKLPETRAKRIDGCIDRLLQGKRRPCCFNRVPFEMQDALKASPKAKANWSALSGDAQRDFVDWIVEAKENPVRKTRIDKACSLIAAGKQHP
jgi:uncharacterized protein YdeI (YjbR/CyaY-like superfamily)